MFDKLKEVEEKYEKLKQDLYDPQIAQDHEKVREINQEITQLKDLYELYQEYKDNENQLKEAKEVIRNESDSEIVEMAEMQLQEAKNKKPKLEKKLKLKLLPKDPNDDKNIFLEIRSAAWGDEAGLFAHELMKMYIRYAESKWWSIEIVEEEMSGIWALKKAIVKMAGDKIYSKMKFESGVHRVQRIPETESKWRVHTSTVTVAVMPEVEDVEVDVDPSDIEMQTFAASSAWGQHANRNACGVRLIHEPSGVVVRCDDTRSQRQNKKKAMKVLKVKIYQTKLEKQQQEQKEKRANQIGTGWRSEKIRTYNFPQDRITDHRINQSWSNIPGVLEGDIDNIINTLVVENQAKLLAAQSE